MKYLNMRKAEKFQLKSQVKFAAAYGHTRIITE